MGVKRGGGGIFQDFFGKVALPVRSTVIISLNLSTKISFSFSVLHFFVLASDVATILSLRAI